MRWRKVVPTALGIGALAALTYGVAYERNRWTLRRYDVPVLALDAEPLRVLHLSDLHLLPHQRRKQAWIRSLAALDPDLVVVTGDLLGSADALAAVNDALTPLFDYPGAFTFGNSDYFGPVLKSPLAYVSASAHSKQGEQMPSKELSAMLTAAGWLDLNNHRTTIKAGGRAVEVSGVDDPHLERDGYLRVAGPVVESADVHIGLLHAPEPRLIDNFSDDGFELILAGHTHGGQVCIPGYGAIVTNSGIDRDKVKGLHRWRGDSWLHVSAGLGTSPKAPIRFACPPEASLLTLVSAPESRDPAITTVGRVRAS